MYLASYEVSIACSKERLVDERACSKERLVRERACSKNPFAFLKKRVPAAQNITSACTLINDGKRPLKPCRPQSCRLASISNKSHDHVQDQVKVTTTHGMHAMRCVGVSSLTWSTAMPLQASDLSNIAVKDMSRPPSPSAHCLL